MEKKNRAHHPVVENPKVTVNFTVLTNHYVGRSRAVMASSQPEAVSVH